MADNRDGMFGSKVGQIGPNSDKSGIFQIRFQYIWFNEQNQVKKPHLDQLDDKSFILSFSSINRSLISDFIT